MLECGKSIKELSKDNDTECDVLNSYENKTVLIDYNSPMNKVYHYMEDNLLCLKKQAVLVNTDIAKLLKTNKDPLDDFNKINIIKELADDYFAEKSKYSCDYLDYTESELKAIFDKNFDERIIPPFKLGKKYLKEHFGTLYTSFLPNERVLPFLEN